MITERFIQEDKINRRVDLHPPTIKTTGVKELTINDLLSRISSLQTRNDNLTMSLNYYHSLLMHG